MSGKKILMVDDDLEHIEPYAEALEDSGYSVTRAMTVDEALQLLKTETFDLLILDLLMPPEQSMADQIENLVLRETGLRLHRTIRKDLGLQNVPIMFVTLVRDKEIRGKIRQAEREFTGTEPLFLTKPVALYALLAEVNKKLI
jgi:CheY-like chemotaxis protein